MFFVRVNIWWSLPGSGALPSPALGSQLSSLPANRASGVFFSPGSVCLGMPRESYLAEQWNTGPSICLSSYWYASPSLQCLLSLYCCGWKEFIPQGKEMLALAYEPWARGWDHTGKFVAHWGNSLFSKPTSKSCFPHQLFSISLQHIPWHQIRLLHLFFFYVPKRNFWQSFWNLIFSWKTIFSQWSLMRFHSQPQK